MEGWLSFEAKLTLLASRNIIILPKRISNAFPSRGLTLGEGKIRGVSFTAVLEPDGRGSHWFYLEGKLQKEVALLPGDKFILRMRPSRAWPEPPLPEDWERALTPRPGASEMWKSLTPLARWDWLRWIGATAKSKTRRTRLESALDKLEKGERRPCCFNRTQCSVPELSRGGKLREEG
ncbi:MAG: YdeI/OmpD-associated family protein [Spirochaetales bacterium]|nr:YdeI/OmpD-associated family protein [Spirochaetales bacterium]